MVSRTLLFQRRTVHTCLPCSAALRVVRSNGTLLDSAGGEGKCSHKDLYIET